ncbi:nucleotidyl transferase AbiEii/AbiGii toxin family protein [Nocardia alni]|uniref:nucleotidyl transferase AbiEii/AbiGii toxin family protein n=1 Tax=Nocardia alni TaxID=2815723 RepID=UPI001C23BED2|nr:nucleotidyl transferase AbiEii/AbiGii toxin family protein [Nocardia alni]
MFEREHHRLVAQVLEALDAEILADHHCLFGGGTAIALRYGEFRESVDIDFLVSDIDGYRGLRELIKANGVEALVRTGQQLHPLRDVRADQYGIRTVLQAEDAPVKFEIVLEGRIHFDPPGARDRVCGLATLAPVDMAASKLLANSDRWADDAVYSRDVIDLAMMSPSRDLLRAAAAKAASAYGSSIERDLTKAVAALRDRPGRLDRCMQALRMTDVPKAVLWQQIRALPKSISTG